MELSRRPGGPLLHVGHHGPHDAPRLQRPKFGGVRIVDAVPQGGKDAAGGVIEGHGADAGHGVPQPHPQLVGPRRGLHRLGRQLEGLLPPLYLEGHFLPRMLGQMVLDLLNGVHLAAVPCG